MKMNLKKAGLAVLVMLFVLSGCAAGAKEPERTEQAVALVLGVHANSRELNFNNARLQDVLTQADYVSILVNDGKPFIADKRGFVLPEQYKGASKTMLEEQAKSRVHSLLYEVSSLQAISAESDPLEALRLAANSLRSYPETASKTIYIADTGLQTCGYLVMNDGLLHADAAQVAEALAEKELLPDFHGITVFWQHMGDTDDPQKPLSPAQKTALETLWKTVVEAGGGNFEAVREDPNQGGYSEGFPQVTPIDFSDEEPLSLSDIGTAGLRLDAPVFIDEETIRFVGDSAEYAEPEKALEALQPVAAYLQTEPDVCLLLCGTTAGDEDTDFAQALSEARAQAVKETLVSLGADEARIRALGLGSHDRWHIKGAGLSGSLAAKNRKVVLLDASSEIATQILKEQS